MDEERLKTLAIRYAALVKQYLHEQDESKKKRIEENLDIMLKEVKNSAQREFLSMVYRLVDTIN